MKQTKARTHVFPQLVLGPSPAYSVFDFELDGETLLAYLCRRSSHLILGALVRLRVEGFCVESQEVGHSDDPCLCAWSARQRGKAGGMYATDPSVLRGRGRLGKDTSASLSATGASYCNGSVSSVYSKACRRSLSGVGRRSEPLEGDAGLREHKYAFES